MPERATSKRVFVRSLLTGTLMTAGFVVVTTWILLAANGYVVNLRTLSVEQRSLISLNGAPSQATVTVDGQLASQKLPVVVRGVLPGQHAIRMSAPGYQDWELAVKVGSGQAVVRDTILLFRTTPIEQGAPSATAVAGVPLVDPSLSVNGTEISLLSGSQRLLITRFSQPILAARLSNDREHVYIQLGAQLFVTELDGANTTLLLTLANDTPALIAPSGRDSILTIKTDDVLRAWQIR